MAQAFETTDDLLGYVHWWRPMPEWVSMHEDVADPLIERARARLTINVV